MRNTGKALWALVGLGVVAWVCACVGDDPPVSSTSPTDGGSTEEGGSSDANGGTDSGDASTSDSGCGDTNTSEANCGTCGHVCKSGAGCFAGRCGNEVLDLSAGASSTCAVLASHRVYCWGDNSALQVGDPGGVNHSTPFLIAQDFFGNAFDGVVQVSVGEKHACARKADGTIWCWGNGDSAQLALQASTAKPIKIPNVTNFKSIAVGGYQTCGIDGSDTVQCWGGNAHGALGHAQNSNGDIACGVPEGTHCNGTPKQIALVGAGNLTAEMIAVGRAHGCALTPITHTVQCWGLNDDAQLGAAGADSPQPLIVTAAAGATALAVGGRGHSCVVKAGKLECWGTNVDGEIGTGSTTSPLAPTTAFGALSGVKLGAAAGSTLCAYDTKLHCAGFAALGAVGHGTFVGNAGPDQTMVIDVAAPDGGAPLTNLVRLAPGSVHMCAATADHQIYCWGNNINGQLGNGTSGSGTNSAVPTRVVGLP